MASSGMKKFLPAFIPLFFELMRHFKRNASHDNNIRRTDKTAEKIATVENLIVRLEKRVTLNREVYQKTAFRIYLWLAANSLLLLIILLKVLQVI